MDRVLKYRYINAQELTHQFQIRWKGFTEFEDTWEDAKYIYSIDQEAVELILGRMAASRKKEALLDYLEIEA